MNDLTSKLASMIGELEIRNTALELQLEKANTDKENLQAKLNAKEKVTTSAPEPTPESDNKEEEPTPETKD
nr:MAG TPA: hypothetical protein [Caudoviricetes sp.]